MASDTLFRITRVLRQIPADVLRPVHRLVLLALADATSAETGEAWPSVPSIAKWTGQSPRTVDSALADLRRDGWITSRRRSDGQGGWLSSAHTVCLDRLPPPTSRAPSAPSRSEAFEASATPPAIHVPLPQQSATPPAAERATPPAEIASNPPRRDPPNDPPKQIQIAREESIPETNRSPGSIREPPAPSPPPGSAPRSAAPAPKVGETLPLLPDEPPPTPAPKARRPNRDADVDAVLEHWASESYHGHRPKLTPARRARVAARLAEGFTVDEIKLALDHAAEDDFLMGRVPGRPKRYTDIETLLRDAAQVERLRDLVSSDPDEDPPSGLQRQPPKGWEPPAQVRENLAALRAAGKVPTPEECEAAIQRLGARAPGDTTSPRLEPLPRLGGEPEPVVYFRGKPIRPNDLRPKETR